MNIPVIHWSSFYTCLFQPKKTVKSSGLLLMLCLRSIKVMLKFRSNLIIFNYFCLYNCILLMTFISFQTQAVSTYEFYFGHMSTQFWLDSYSCIRNIWLTQVEKKQILMYISIDLVTKHITMNKLTMIILREYE